MGNTKKLRIAKEVIRVALICILYDQKIQRGGTIYNQLVEAHCNLIGIPKEEFLQDVEKKGGIDGALSNHG